jgi:hypothetical protein
VRGAAQSAASAPETSALPQALGEAVEI